MLPIDLAKKLALQAGSMMINTFGSRMTPDWKANHTPVTETDIAINTLVLTEIEKYFPDHSVLAEEGSNIKTSDYVWICDPIDGTIPFSHGIPTCVFAIALTYKGESILNVVYDPFLKRLFWAEKGKGAWMNDRPLRVSEKKELTHAVIGYSPSRSIPGLFQSLIQFAQQEHIHIVAVGSAIYSGMLVATGDLTASIFAGKKAHDSSPLKNLIEEAGGKMTSVSGEEQRYDQEVNGHIVSNGFLHERFLQIILKHQSE